MTKPETKPAENVSGDKGKKEVAEKAKKIGKLQCAKKGCKGRLDIDNMKIINNMKMQTRCSICGKIHTLTPNKSAGILNGNRKAPAKRAIPKQYKSKKERRAANKLARETAAQIEKSRGIA